MPKPERNNSLRIGIEVELLSVLELADVSFSYDGKLQILDRLNYQMEQGEFHCLLGRSGCGKTSLLKVASGIQLPSTGMVKFNGQAVYEPLTDAGFVFQSPTLLQWRTVIENVLLPIQLKRKVTAADKEQALQLLTLMGIQELSEQYPRDLSGGQQSRVAIARALINQPSVLFMDEPFAALDAITREDLQRDLLKLCKKEGITVLFITHDIAEAVYLADYVAVMSTGRLIYETEIRLPDDRPADVRYSEEFNAIGLRIRRAIEKEM